MRAVPHAYGVYVDGPNGTRICTRHEQEFSPPAQCPVCSRTRAPAATAKSRHAAIAPEINEQIESELVEFRAIADEAAEMAADPGLGDSARVAALPQSTQSDVTAKVKSALDVHLSSTDRGASTVQDVMARNEVSLLLSLYAYQVLHGLRCLLERQTRQGWSLSRMREQVLKVAATLSLHARRITVHLGDAADKWWPTLLKGLPKLTALS